MKMRKSIKQRLETLAHCIISVLEYVSNSGSWKRWFKMLLSMGAVVVKGGNHG